jgi:hypothetical protein
VTRFIPLVIGSSPLSIVAGTQCLLPHIQTSPLSDRNSVLTSPHATVKAGGLVCLTRTQPLCEISSGAALFSPACSMGRPGAGSILTVLHAGPWPAANKPRGCEATRARASDFKRACACSMFHTTTPACSELGGMSAADKADVLVFLREEASAIPPAAGPQRASRSGRLLKGSLPSGSGDAGFFSGQRVDRDSFLSKKKHSVLHETHDQNQSPTHSHLTSCPLVLR